MKKNKNDILVVLMDENIVIEYETKECRIVSFKDKYYLQIHTNKFGWAFALSSLGKELKAKEYETYNEVMIDILKWENKRLTDN